MRARAIGAKGGGGQGEGGRMFFFEKKNQKTFVPSGTRLTNSPRQPEKSFLLLFFKKEVLVFPCLSSRPPIRT
jgi:hypothetical protein